MNYSWKRPENVPFPQVWLKFKAKDLNSENLVEYRVEDLPLDRYEDAIDHMFTHFIINEPRYKSLGASIDDEELAKEARRNYKFILEQKIALACFKEGSDELIGVNLVAITLKEEQNKIYVPSAEKLRKVFRAKDICQSNFDLFEHYNVDKFMTAHGLSVNSKYGGRRIGEYILRARVPLGRAIGVELTSGCFSAISSQKVAFKAGFECNFEITYDDIAKVDPQCVFPGIETKSMKIVSMRL